MTDEMGAPTTVPAALRRSLDRKITNLTSPNGKTARIANTFGLPAGRDSSCPGATATCERVCYAGRLEKRYSGVRHLLDGNLRALTGRDRAGMAELLLEMIAAFRADCERAQWAGAVVPLDFRIHWDGDFFSLAYAEAWADTVRDNPDIRFWVYTRSFDPAALDVVPALSGLPNLTLYLSVDQDNRPAAEQARLRHPWVLWAYLAETFADGEAALTDVSVKRYPCPENGGRIPLISTRGSACIRCGICLDGRGDVLFSSKRR
ncbi:GP88 family protein [Modestobacter sp. SYSU DS0290]